MCRRSGRPDRPESSLPLHEECVAVVDTRADQGVELSGISRTVAPLGQKVRIQIRQYDRASGTRARVLGSRSAKDVGSRTGRRVQVQIVCTGRSQVDSVRPSSAEGDDGVAQDLTFNLCKLPCRMFGTWKWGSTSEMLEAENCEGSVIWLGKTAVCWLGICEPSAPSTYVTEACCDSVPLEITELRKFRPLKFS